HCQPSGKGWRWFISASHSWQSSQLTVSTGRSAPLKWLGLLPIALSHCTCVVSVFASQKPLVKVTRCRVSPFRPFSPSISTSKYGPPSGAPSGTLNYHPPGLPIVNVPGGHHTISMPPKTRVSPACAPSIPPEGDGVL